MKPLCIYHGNCADGFTAAWVVNRFFGIVGVEFHPGIYGQKPPDVDGRNVILVDFSYKRPVLDAMLRSGDTAQALTILILDHHKTAAEDLAGIASPENGYDARGWRSGGSRRWNGLSAACSIWTAAAHKSRGIFSFPANRARCWSITSVTVICGASATAVARGQLLRFRSRIHLRELGSP